MIDLMRGADAETIVVVTGHNHALIEAACAARWKAVDTF